MGSRWRAVWIAALLYAVVSGADDSPQLMGHRMKLWYNSHLSCANNTASNLLLSIIVTTTNVAPRDQLDRLQLQIDNLEHYSSQLSLSTRLEYIIVEYNYSPDAPALRAQLRFEASASHLVRIIRVSREWHDLISTRIGFTGRIDFNEFYAKNIGIRRACAPFVMVTASDILFPESFYRHLSEGTLLESAFYRAPRCNVEVDQNALANKSSPERVSISQQNITQCWVCTGHGHIDYYRKNMGSSSLPASGRTRAECIGGTGDFLIMSRNRWTKYRGFPDVALHHVLDDVPLYQAVADGAQLISFPSPTAALHINHKKGYRTDDRFNLDSQMLRAFAIQEDCKTMMEERKLRVFNDES